MPTIKVFFGPSCQSTLAVPIHSFCWNGFDPFGYDGTFERPWHRVADPMEAGKDYFRRTGIFPIMHLIGVRRTLVEKHPWLPAAVFKAFNQSKKVALEQLTDVSATKVTGDSRMAFSPDGTMLLAPGTGTSAALWAKEHLGKPLN